MFKKPEIIVFAGPNGSGKSTITDYIPTVGMYINADEIEKANHCTTQEAAIKADELRNKAVSERKDFTFETVLSTDRNLKLLQKAKENGYFIRCIYVLTDNPSINVARVASRVLAGGHNVPPNKIISRYANALNLIPEVLEVCDVCHIYDNTKEPFRIFKKRKNKYCCWKNKYWYPERIEKLTGYKFKGAE